VVRYSEAAAISLSLVFGLLLARGAEPLDFYKSVFCVNITTMLRIFHA
jgi:hypothetical protein